MAKKRLHPKSSAALISLTIHLVFILVAISFVAITVIQKEDRTFEGKIVKRPVKKLRKLQVPVKEVRKPKPKLRKNIVVKNVNRSTPELQLPEIVGVAGGIGSGGDGGGVEAIGFSMPEMDFLGAKGKSEKVCFLVHFGQSTMQDKLLNGSPVYTPFSRMTALVIRNRLSELISGLPPYTLFNVAAFQMSRMWAMSPEMMAANDMNKQRVFDWMEPVNPIDPEISDQYGTCFDLKNGELNNLVNNASKNWPTRIEDGLPFYTPKWIYPYELSIDLRKKYAPDAAEFVLKREDYPRNIFWGTAFNHWGRCVAWAVLEQKPDTIFVLTTNYYDGWAVTDKKTMSSGEKVREFQHKKMIRAVANMVRDNYGPDKKVWPKINIVVLTPGGSQVEVSHRILNEDFGDLLRAFNGNGVVIEDIKEFMTDEEKNMFYEFKSAYGSS